MNPLNLLAVTSGGGKWAYASGCLNLHLSFHYEEHQAAIGAHVPNIWRQVPYCPA